MEHRFPMTEMQKNETARVEELDCSGPMRRRLQDIGLIEGTRVRRLFRRVPGGPTAYRIRGAVIALRPADSDRVLVSGGRNP